MDREKQIKRLLEHAFFQGLRPLEIKALFSAGEVRAFESGQVLFNQGNPSDGLFFVMSGVFEVRLESKDFPLAHVKEGEVIGEVGDDSPGEGDVSRLNLNARRLQEGADDREEGSLRTE